MRGKLWMIIGSSSNHKSTLLRMSLWNASKAGHNPIYMNFEDTKENIIGRTFASEIKEIDTHFFFTGEKPKGITPYDMERIFSKLGTHLESDPSVRMRYVDLSSPTISRLCGLISTEVARGADMVGIDFFQLIRPDRGREDPEHWKAASQALHDLAKDLNVPIIATAQVTHEAQREQDRTGRHHVVNDVIGGSAIKNNIWGALLLNKVSRDEAGWQPDPRKIHIQVAKNKGGKQMGGVFGVMPSRDLITD